MTATAFVLRRQGHYDAAITQLKSALERDPRNTIYAFELGATEAMAGRYAEVEHMLQRAQALDPDNIQAKLLSSSLTLLSSGDIPRALNQAQGDSPQLTWQRVSLLTYQRDYRAAITLLDGIPDTSDNFTIINGPKPYQLGNLYGWRATNAQAHTLFEEVATLAACPVRRPGRQSDKPRPAMELSRRRPAGPGTNEGCIGFDCKIAGAAGEVRGPRIRSRRRWNSTPVSTPRPVAPTSPCPRSRSSSRHLVPTTSIHR